MPSFYTLILEDTNLGFQNKLVNLVKLPVDYYLKTLAQISEIKKSHHNFKIEFQDLDHNLKIEKILDLLDSVEQFKLKISENFMPFKDIQIEYHEPAGSDHHFDSLSNQPRPSIQVRLPPIRPSQSIRFS